MHETDVALTTPPSKRPAMRMIQDLTNLISPFDPKEFREQYWETNFIRIDRNDPAFYDGLFGIKEANDFLSRRDIQYPKIMLVKEGKPINQKKYLKDLAYGNLSFDGIVDNDKLFHLFNQGATILFHDLGRSFQSLYNLSQSLAIEFTAPCKINGYLTPPNSKGFTPHYDTHDVFIIQLHGSKCWRLYDHSIQKPHKEQSFDPRNWDQKEPSSEFTMKTGDIAYIPSGMVHEANTQEKTSFHLTIGVHSYEWRNSFQEQLIQNQIQDSSNRLLDSLRISSISPQSCLMKRAAIRFSVWKSSDHLELHYYQKKVSFSVEDHKAIEWIGTNGKRPFFIFQLPSCYSNETKMAICTKLVREGFLTICD